MYTASPSHLSTDHKQLPFLSMHLHIIYPPQLHLWSS